MAPSECPCTDSGTARTDGARKFWTMWLRGGILPEVGVPELRIPTPSPMARRTDGGIDVHEAADGTADERSGCRVRRSRGHGGSRLPPPAGHQRAGREVEMELAFVADGMDRKADRQQRLQSPFARMQCHRRRGHSRRNTRRRGAPGVSWEGAVPHRRKRRVRSRATRIACEEEQVARPPRCGRRQRASGARSGAVDERAIGTADVAQAPASASKSKTQCSRDKAASGTPMPLPESRPNVTVVVSRG